jgi:hypothetical protein
VCEVEIERLGVLRNAVMPAAMVRCDA